MVDLHLHSTASDGTVPPRVLPSMGVSAHLSAIALTDHDSVAGIPEFLQAAHELGIPAIAGIELNTRIGTADLHILGYGPDIHHPALLEEIARIQHNRYTRNLQMLEILADMGFPLELSEVEAVAGDPLTLGRPHFALAMVRRGYMHSVREAFERVLGDGKPAAIRHEPISAPDGVRLLRQAGALPVWAHPRATFSSLSFRKILPLLIAEGLAGVEAYHPIHSNTKTRDVIEAAHNYGLLVTGGSDFHGACKPDISIGRGTGKLRVPDECWTKLRERMEKDS